MPRKNRPWYRAGRGWYVCHRGKQIALGVIDPRDEAAAQAAFDALPVRPVLRGLPADPARRALVLVRELLAVLGRIPELENRERRVVSLTALEIDLDVMSEPEPAKT